MIIDAIFAFMQQVWNLINSNGIISTVLSLGLAGLIGRYNTQKSIRNSNVELDFDWSIKSDPRGNLHIENHGSDKAVSLRINITLSGYFESKYVNKIYTIPDDERFKQKVKLNKKNQKVSFNCKTIKIFFEHELEIETLEELYQQQKQQKEKEDFEERQKRRSFVIPNAPVMNADMEKLMPQIYKPNMDNGEIIINGRIIAKNKKNRKEHTYLIKNKYLNII